MDKLPQTKEECEKAIRDMASKIRELESQYDFLNELYDKLPNE